MKARPILMSAPMVRALLAGTKTQTRRAIKPQPGPDGLCRWSATLGKLDGPLHSNPWIDSDETHWQCPYGDAADLLWVRETFAEVGNVDPPWVLYRANGYDNECKRHRFTSPPPESEQQWRPSIFMPKRLSRLTLRITDVRVQRVRQISEEDCRAEGVFFTDYGRNRYGAPNPGWMWQQTTEHAECLGSAQSAYGNLWATINGIDSWQRNDWCWTLTFEVLQKNVDEVLANG